ncbi:DUF350 domain-containing protein [Paenibacillus sp. 598K]|uniref:DUF350 domain-containing protein n=1 Tax=Paenibacillus sp. 598K TaxID=1117987 RepID=UPI000FFEFAC9|nr:hypothetical protein [Paenibacillus sp. 598K]
MSGWEVFVLMVSGSVTIGFVIMWYYKILRLWPRSHNVTGRLVLGALPILSFILLLRTLQSLASYDVVDNALFIVFYLLLGFLCLAFGSMMTRMRLDLSWEDDALRLGNRAALAAYACAFMGMTMIYLGANIGDGPGWWSVVFAGGLGFAAWLALAGLFNKYAYVSERITVERNISTGIRFGAYLLASGILLGRASSGDWTSWWMTIVEFLAGWPVLLLTLWALQVERADASRSHDRGSRHDQTLPTALIWAVLYIAFAIVSVMLLPDIPGSPIPGWGARP